MVALKPNNEEVHKFLNERIEEFWNENPRLFGKLYVRYSVTKDLKLDIKIRRTTTQMTYKSDISWEDMSNPSKDAFWDFLEMKLESVMTFFENNLLVTEIIEL